MKLRVKEIDRLFVLVILLGGCIMATAQPDWSVNTAAYHLDGSIVASLTIDDVLSEDPADKVAAFDEAGNVRGVSNLSYDVISNSYVAYLTVLSADYGDELTFKIYDASQDRIYVATNAPVTFVSNLDMGNIFEPYAIEASVGLSSTQEVFPLFSYGPNPAKEKVQIQAGVLIDEIRIYNMVGELLSSGKINTSSVQVDLSGYETGVYVIKVVSGNLSKSVRILKQ